MLSMFSKRPAPEKARSDKRIEPSTTRAAQDNVTPLKMPLKVDTPAVSAAAPTAMAAERQASQQRLKIFDNVPSAGQYIYHLNNDIRTFTRAETESAVVKCTPVEVQRVARLLAKLKGRYLAQVVDLGSLKRASIGEMDIADLKRAREMAEEVETGLAALRQAIERGDLPIDGIKSE
jgi:hypothetical protein